MELQKVRIYSFEDKEFTDPGEELDKKTPTFVTPINPESFTKTLKIDVDVRRGHGGRGTDVRFKSVAPEELKLDFILDGTATMEGYRRVNVEAKLEDRKIVNEVLPVEQQLKNFLDCVYKMSKKIHRPKFLLLIWGSEIRFRCVLSSLDINYTLFNPDGKPLRAKLSCTFVDYKTREQRIAEDKPSSPDLTHYRRVKEGDRLDYLTYRIYNDPKYLLQVGKVNHLTTIRRIRSGSDLYFPPFDQKEI
ncbi:CIS tube protein [Flavitalea sp.]|nr:hypothetical protein [Flavitalea sp.]